MGGTYLNVKAALYAGTDMMLNTGTQNWTIDGYAENATLMTLMRQSAKRILYTVSRSHAMNGISASSKVVKIMPSWQKWLITADVLIGVCALLGAGYITFRLVKPPKKKEKA
jgi:beta-glucosidase